MKFFVGRGLLHLSSGFLHWSIRLILAASREWSGVGLPQPPPASRDIRQGVSKIPVSPGNSILVRLGKLTEDAKPRKKPRCSPAIGNRMEKGRSPKMPALPRTVATRDASNGNDAWGSRLLHHTRPVRSTSQSRTRLRRGRRCPRNCVQTDVRSILRSVGGGRLGKREERRRKTVHRQSLAKLIVGRTCGDRLELSFGGSKN